MRPDILTEKRVELAEDKALRARAIELTAEQKRLITVTGDVHIPGADDKAGGEVVAYLCEAGNQFDLIRAADFVADQYVFAGWKITPLYNRPQPQAEFMEWRRVLAEKVDAHIQGESDGEGAGDEAYADLKAHILDALVAQPKASTPEEGANCYRLEK